MNYPMRAPEDDGTSGTGEGTPAPAPAAAPAPPPVYAAPVVPTSPELEAARAAARREARLRGEAEAEVTRLRGDAESARLAAEAQRSEAMATQVRGILGDEGVASWQRISELSATDPIKAAEEMAAFGRSMVQSQQAVDRQTPPAAPPQHPALPSLGVGANAPLGQSTTDNSWEKIRDEAAGRFDATVAASIGPLEGRRRVTEKSRTGAIMDHVISGIADQISKGWRPGGHQI